MERNEPTWTIDCRTLPAPYPLLGARAAMSLMRDGEVLALLVTDPDSVLDLPVWCRMTGNRLIESRRRESVHCVLIQRMRSSPAVRGTTA
jgi:tRNA 2-thiouridine synthesizing protein A